MKKSELKALIKECLKEGKFACVEWDELVKKIQSVDNDQAIKLVYQWVKQDHITPYEMFDLIGEILKRVKK
jgi:hypothetical protein